MSTASATIPTTTPTTTTPTPAPAPVDEAKSQMMPTISIGCIVVICLCGLIYFLHSSGSANHDISGALAKYGTSLSSFKP